MNASTPYTDINEAMLEIKRLREQLAAEQEKHAFELAAEVEKAYDKGRQHNDVAISEPLRQQLAAEQEKFERATKRWLDLDTQLAVTQEIGRRLAMLSLQSDRYATDPEYREATDAALKKRI